MSAVVTGKMVMAGVDVLHQSKIGDLKTRVVRNIYEAMDKAKPAPKGYTEPVAVAQWWPASTGKIAVHTMTTEHVVRSLQRLARDLGNFDVTPEEEDFKLKWIGVFYEELKRRCEDLRRKRMDAQEDEGWNCGV